MSVLALDAGPTGVTAVVVGADGQVVATASAGFAEQRAGPGRVEHAPEEIWRATLGATREVLGRVDVSELTAIGVAAQRETVVLWDRETLGSPRPAIAGHDQRTAAICERLRAEGHADRVAELTGIGLDPGFSGTTLMWLAEHEPHTWALVVSGRYAVGTVDSYLVARMTRGTWHVTDMSHAGRTLLLDLRSGDWSAELCRLFGVPRDALPDLVPSWGEVAPSDSRAFLSLELPIAGIAADRQAALFGQTGSGIGDAVWTHGPGSAVLAHAGTTLERPDAALLPTLAWRSPDGDLTRALEGAVPAPASPGTGSPHGGAVVRDVLLGVTRATPRATLGAAASTVRDVLGSAGTSGSGADGGDATDALRRRALADLLGLPVERPVEGGSALGAALLAGLGAGVWHSTDALRDLPARRRANG